ncbi:MAG: ABC transporter ATP-binding protein [Defluviitaleaceae bacterium]|nr:ABC transporter ATP-binding protein [Defluviitaleaceae bacterium]
MLKIQGATKYYGETTALRNANLSLSRGEVVGLFGANGAGKTTLLKSAMGLLKLDSGWITIDSSDISREAFQKLSFITEEGSYFADLTPHAHGEFYANMLPRFKPDRYNKLLDFFELEPNKKARTFSRGQRAKLEIAIGMSRGADFILMDEPFLGKDIFTRSDFLKLMIAMLEPHEGTLIATHQIEEIEMFITRAAIIKDGQIIASQQMDDLIAQEENLPEFIQKCYGYDHGRVMGFLQ